jgi:hypothetical protein
MVFELYLIFTPARYELKVVLIEEGRAASKSPQQTFGYFLSISKQEVSAIIIQNSTAENFTPKTEGTKTKAARCLFFLMSFTFLYILNLLLLFTFWQVCLLLKETAEIETGMAEKSSWDQANIRQKKLGLAGRNRKKISQIIKDYFYLPLFLLIILRWYYSTFGV